MTTQQPEALRLAELLELAPEDGVEPQTTEDAAAELRRQHTSIAELEARIKTMAEEHADELMVAHLDGRSKAAQQPTPTPQADSQPAPVREPALQDVRCACCGYMTYRREHIGCIRAARAPADSVLEDAAQVEIDLFNDLNRIYGNTLTAYAKEMCRLGYRKTNAARKQGANHD